MRSFSLSLLGSIAVLSVAASSAGAKELVVPFATGGRPTTGDASTATNPAMDVVLADVSLETALEQALNMTTELVAGTISEMVAQHRRSHLRQRENRLKERAEVAEREEIEKRSLKLRYPYGSEKVRGVSLGGWLVLESFITPSVFDATGNEKIVDEWTFGSLQSKTQAKAILQKHLNTFVTEDDFRQIAALGLNHVRIPIPYWAFEVQGNEPFVMLNQYDLLKQAAMWAKTYGLKILIDLHAAPGNQNGYDHGGHRGVNQWASKKSYVDRTLAILQTMSVEFSQKKYAKSVAAIELLNEPNTDINVVKQFYKDGYNKVRHLPDGSTSHILVVIGDAFHGPESQPDYWKGFYPLPQYEGCALDSHVYTIFDDNSIRLKSADRINVYCSRKQAYANADKNLYEIIGEWTPVFTDCARNLNGRGTGSRYEGTLSGSRGRIGSCGPKTGSGATFTDGYKRLLGRFWEAQASAYEGGSGWIMWTWKTESADEWSYQAGVKYGWIPKDPTARPFGETCN